MNSGGSRLNSERRVLTPAEWVLEQLQKEQNFLKTASEKSHEVAVKANPSVSDFATPLKEIQAALSSAGAIYKGLNPDSKYSYLALIKYAALWRSSKDYRLLAEILNSQIKGRRFIS